MSCGFILESQGHKNISDLFLKVSLFFTPGSSYCKLCVQLNEKYILNTPNNILSHGYKNIKDEMICQTKMKCYVKQNEVICHTKMFLLHQVLDNYNCSQ